jgi:hypothetical protein
MDGIRELLETVRDRGLAIGTFRGLLHIVIGRRITKADGTVISNGLTWRELAALLKLLRYDKDLVREFGTDPEDLAPRDRQRFWYSAIAIAKVDSPDAFAQAQRLAEKFKELGYTVGPPPVLSAQHAVQSTPSPPAPRGKAKKDEEHEEKPSKRKKK